ncbi:hypothetical protein D0868_15901 [Hortaea werneckii]|uniref:Uncharacterized protein n=1 Tax=Hortaea werneckii TaxID=91943 RepID=A0A3M6WTI7_HORWE|nr:hypothetical protein D0868_15901 [Hortaea werneckii]
MWTDLLHHASSIYHSIHHLAHTITDAHDEMAASPYERAKESVEFLRLKLPEQLAFPRVAIVCGSGLGGLAQTVNDGEAVMHKTTAGVNLANHVQSSRS